MISITIQRYNFSKEMNNQCSSNLYHTDFIYIDKQSSIQYVMDLDMINIMLECFNIDHKVINIISIININLNSNHLNIINSY